MDSNKKRVNYQIDWILGELDNMVSIGPRFGTNINNLDDESDILTVSLVNPILVEAIKKIEECRSRFNGQNDEKYSCNREGISRQDIRNFESDRTTNRSGFSDNRSGKSSGIV